MALAELEPRALTVRPVIAAADGHGSAATTMRRLSVDLLSAAAGSLVLVAGVPEVPGAGARAAVVSLLLVMAWVVLMRRNGADRDRIVDHPRAQLLGLLRAAAEFTVLTAALAWALLPDLAPPAALGAVGVTVVGSTGHRAGVALAGRLRRTTGAGRRRVLVVGRPAEAETFAADLRRRAGSTLEVVGTCPPDLDAVSDLPDRAAALGADGVLLLACSDLPPAVTRRLAWRLAEHDQHLLVSPGLVDVQCHRASLVAVGGVPLVHVAHARSRCPQRTLSHLGGRAVAAVGLVAVTPLLVALTLAIRWESPGPAWFRQTRIGRDGVPFTMLKFRTMRDDAVLLRPELEAANEGAGVLFKMRHDPRVTRLGAVLRRYSLDELPQLVNVVRGEMALVGPRPALPEEVAAYSPDARRRLATVPGITGLWQVSGRSDLDWEESMRLDLSYVDNWSPLLDAHILLRTVGAVVGHRGAY